jgi:uncharacterized protein YaiE (UPF0345 family)
MIVSVCSQQPAVLNRQLVNEIIKLINLNFLTMFKTNEYFGGKVKSIAFTTKECTATIGVMAPGEYEFGTSTVEHMTVTSGKLTVRLPGGSEWKDFKPFDTFIIEKDKKFQLIVKVESSYLCLYK